MNLLEEAFNIKGIFDAMILTVTTLRRKDTEDGKVKALVDRKGRFSASAIYTNIGTVCVTSSAVFKAQRIQLGHQKKLQEANKNKKKSTQNRKLLDAQVVRVKHERGETLSAVDLKITVMYILLVSKATDASSRYSTRKQCERRPEELPSPWWTYI